MGSEFLGTRAGLYLGNTLPATTTDGLCKTICGGVSQSIRNMQDNHIAVNPAAALTFFHAASYQGLMLNHWRLELDWGKNAGPPPLA
ncbi:hypothetical protein BC827DRAFT_526550 [Russula dissimulans]|nr:hypothetical protein BC827DRAFT_526550 [Russula dissimulans]